MTSTRVVLKRHSKSPAHATNLSHLNLPSLHIAIMTRPDITLYTAQTPNGIKISMALEELGYVCLLPVLAQ